MKHFMSNMKNDVQYRAVIIPGLILQVCILVAAVGPRYDWQMFTRLSIAAISFLPTLICVRLANRIISSRGDRNA
jgi:hypothetical protein